MKNLNYLMIQKDFERKLEAQKNEIDEVYPYFPEWGQILKEVVDEYETSFCKAYEEMMERIKAYESGI